MWTRFVIVALKHFRTITNTTEQMNHSHLATPGSGGAGRYKESSTFSLLSRKCMAWLCGIKENDCIPQQVTAYWNIHIRCGETATDSWVVKVDRVSKQEVFNMGATLIIRNCTLFWSFWRSPTCCKYVVTNDCVRISQVRQRLVSSCQVLVSSCPAQTQEAQYAQKKYSQSCIFKAHIITS